MVKIGLEIHGYLVCKEKLFCDCAADYKQESIKPNINICPICCGYPGSKPMLPNAEALKKIIAIGLMLGCKINIAPEKKLIWQRKHYDWPDLPKGYQETISGYFSVPVAENGDFLGIKIREIHLEEDPAAWNPENGYVDYNRCGLPLVEIVTEPDFQTSKQVREWLNQLVITLSYINAVEKDAGIKADVNVSTSGERVEIKNLNSITAIEKAIDYETARQIGEEKQGRKIKRETRTFDEKRKITILMREKEEQEDYRFIPEPDLPVILIHSEIAENIGKKLPESPHAKIEKFVEKYHVDKKAAEVLAANRDIAEFFEKVYTRVKDAKLAAYWCTIELLRVLNWNKKQLNEVDINPEHFSELLELVKAEKITELKAKQILNEFVPKSFPPGKLKELEKISKKEIEEICKKVLEENEKAIEDYKSGKKEALDFLIGRVVQGSKRRADSRIVKEILLGMI